MFSEQTKAISSNAIKAAGWQLKNIQEHRARHKQTKRNRHRHTRLSAWCAEIEIRESTQTAEFISADEYSQVARLVSRERHDLRQQFLAV